MFSASLRYGHLHRSLWQTEMQSGPEKSPELDTAPCLLHEDNLRCGVEALMASSLGQSSVTFVLSLWSSHGILISKRCPQTTKRKRNYCAAWARRSETFA